MHHNFLGGSLLEVVVSPTSCEVGSLSCCLPNPHGCFQSEVWGFISPSWSPGLHSWLCQPPPCHESSLPWLPVSTPPTCLNECFFFISLVVGLPYSSIFCQFWLFFVFKLLLSFFWLCEYAQCVYLRLHLGFLSDYDSFESILNLPISCSPAD